MENSIFNPHEQEKQLASKVVAGLERISEVFKVLLWEQATTTGLSPIQIQILIFVAWHRRELCTVSHLAREFNITKATVSDAIRVLENKSLISKLPFPGDKRSYSIALTDSGKTIVDSTGGFSQPLKAQVDRLSSQDLEKLWDTLSRLIYQLNRSGILTVQRTCYACAHFEPANDGSPAFCRLLRKDLLTQDIRLDCPEYQEKESVPY